MDEKCFALDFCRDNCRRGQPFALLSACGLAQPGLEGERARVFTADGGDIALVAGLGEPAQHQVHILRQHEPRREAGKRRDRRRLAEDSFVDGEDFGETQFVAGDGDLPVLVAFRRLEGRAANQPMSLTATN